MEAKDFLFPGMGRTGEEPDLFRSFPQLPEHLLHIVFGDGIDGEGFQPEQTFQPKKGPVKARSHQGDGVNRNSEGNTFLSPYVQVILTEQQHFDVPHQFLCLGGRFLPGTASAQEGNEGWKGFECFLRPLNQNRGADDANGDTASPCALLFVQLGSLHDLKYCTGRTPISLFLHWPWFRYRLLGADLFRKSAGYLKTVRRLVF